MAQKPKAPIADGKGLIIESSMSAPLRIDMRQRDKATGKLISDPKRVWLDIFPGHNVVDAAEWARARDLVPIQKRVEDGTLRERGVATG